MKPVENLKMYLWIDGRIALATEMQAESDKKANIDYYSKILM